MHYTEAECRQLLPKWQLNIIKHEAELGRAIEAEDWAAVRRCAIELRFAGTNLAGIANDLLEAEGSR